MVLLNTKCIDLWFLFELVDVKKVSLWQSFLDVYSKALKPRQRTIGRHKHMHTYEQADDHKSFFTRVFNTRYIFEI